MQKNYGQLFLVHRLDCDTSGILFFAKHKKAEGALKKMLQYRQVQKTYSALVWGIPTALSGIIEQPLGPDSNNRPFQKVSKTGKEAITQYTALQTNLDNQALLKLEPKTGRTHQLRVHMQYIGHPILGDTFYGHAPCQNAKPRLCLHAQQIDFVQPISQKPISVFEPADF